jgi:hypothetical protein
MKQQTFTAPEGKITNVKIDGNQVIVEYEEKFEPKDGDFVAGFKSGVLFLSIYKDARGTDCFNYYAMITNNGSHWYNNWGINGVASRYMTNDEKQLLLDALKKDGKRWNAERKCIEETRWRAEYGGVFYSIVFDGNDGLFVPYANTEKHSPIDNVRYDTGRYFQYVVDCQRLCALLNETVKNFKP